MPFKEYISCQPPTAAHKQKATWVCDHCGQRSSETPPLTELLIHNTVTQSTIPRDFLFLTTSIFTFYEVFKLCLCSSRLFTFDCSFPNSLKEEMPDPHCPLWLTLSHLWSFRRRSCNSLSRTEKKKEKKHGHTYIKQSETYLLFSVS